MTTVLDDIRVLLHRAEEEGGEAREGVGLGKNEIHPVAYHLKRETDGQLFGETEFNSGYRGVRSPDIRQVLSFFELGKDKEVFKKEEDDVEHSDEYFRLECASDIRAAEDRLDDLDPEVIDTVDEAIHNLNSGWLEFVKQENEMMKREVGPTLMFS